MPVATVTFRRCIINSPEFWSDDDHVGSRVFFDLSVEGEEFKDLFVDVRQLLDDGTESQPLLVSLPQGYDGPFNMPVFQGLVEFYYRHAIGVQSSMFGTKGLGMRLEGWEVEQEMRIQFEVCDEVSG